MKQDDRYVPVPFDEVKSEWLKESKIKAEYDRLQPEFEIMKKLIEVRAQKGMTQSTLAKKIGTKQSAIARLENGHGNPSLALLQKLADALDSTLEIRFVPR